MKNVIILTNGLSGSSVTAGLLSHAGYWKGESTFIKKDYNTNENSDLIELNKSIMRDLGYREDYKRRFSRDAIDMIATRHAELDPAPYHEFVEHCNANQPWVWKDPRLWLTIRFWKHILDMDNIQFILLSRDYQQIWISELHRRDIISPAYSRTYNEGIRDSLLDFFKENDLEYFDLWYEDLVVRPEQTIACLNDYLGTELSVDDLLKDFRGDLYKKPRGFKDWLIAWAIYLKNYNLRNNKIRTAHKFRPQSELPQEKET